MDPYPTGLQGFYTVYEDLFVKLTRQEELAPVLQVADDTMSKLAKCARPLAEMDTALQIVSVMGPGQTQAHLPAWISRAWESTWLVLHLLPEPQR